MDELYKYLDDKARFAPLLEDFISRSVAEIELNEKVDEGTLKYSDFYKKCMANICLSNVDVIFDYCQSPIEKVFLNSLQLLFIKNQMPCLFVTPPYNDAEKEINAYLNHYQQVDDFISSYKEDTKDVELKHFERRLGVKLLKGEMSQEAIDDVLSYRYFKRTFEWNAYHITPQAGLPSIKVNNKSIRVDFMIWVPSDPKFRLVVECDGFAYHNTQSSFVNDRIRSRILQEKGYRIVQYAGSEINKHPAEMSKNLFDILAAIDKDWDSRIM